MRATAYAKVNWALNILGARPDGYHEMDMLMQPVALCDYLEIEADAELSLEGGGEDDLTLRAARLLRKESGYPGGARMRLLKHIPVRAGLGGGSADCACALIALNRLWGLNYSRDHLMRLGARLGADVPFCLYGRAARVGGMGEEVSGVNAPAGVPLVIIHVGAGLSTAQVFAAFDRMGLSGRACDMYAAKAALESGDLRALRRVSGNALEGAARSLMDGIDRAQDRLYGLGAVFAQMSGSGSAVFGAFSDEGTARRAAEALGEGAILTHTRP